MLRIIVAASAGRGSSCVRGPLVWGSAKALHMLTVPSPEAHLVDRDHGESVRRPGLSSGARRRRGRCAMPISCTLGAGGGLEVVGRGRGPAQLPSVARV